MFYADPALPDASSCRGRDVPECESTPRIHDCDGKTYPIDNKDSPNEIPLSWCYGRVV
jgi:hypothetical protein